MEPLKNISLNELIDSIQSKFEICGAVNKDNDEIRYSRRTLWVVALDAIEFAVYSTAKYYDEFRPVDKPDCEHDSDYSDVERSEFASLIADDEDYDSDGPF
jgi:hypothetical protein